MDDLAKIGGIGIAVIVVGTPTWGRVSTILSQSQINGDANTLITAVVLLLPLTFALATLNLWELKKRENGE